MQAIFFVFFKQKTAYEMRISDWSSDVCSSDLRAAWLANRDARARPDRELQSRREGNRRRRRAVERPPLDPPAPGDQARLAVGGEAVARDQEIGRASCRERVCQYVSIAVVSVLFKKKHITSRRPT